MTIPAEVLGVWGLQGKRGDLVLYLRNRRLIVFTVDELEQFLDQKAND